MKPTIFPAAHYRMSPLRPEFAKGRKTSPEGNKLDKKGRNVENFLFPMQLFLLPAVRKKQQLVRMFEKLQKGANCASWFWVVAEIMADAGKLGEKTHSWFELGKLPE